MSNYYKDNADLQFYVDEMIPWDDIVTYTESHIAGQEGFANTEEAVDFYRQILEMVGDFVPSEITPHVASIDQQGVHLKDGEAVSPDVFNAIFEKIKALELHGMCVPRELGGMNCPILLSLLCNEMFARADVSVMAHHGFHGGVAMALLIFSVLEGSTKMDPTTGQIVSTRFQAEIEEIVRGDAWGCMDITEPDAGSDMAKLKTVGEQDEDGNWFVTGEKIFITSGHGKYHFVIARTERPSEHATGHTADGADDANPMAGLKGLSMFMVPAYVDDPETGQRRRLATVERVEEKLGHHGSVTATVVFDRSAAELIGDRGDGFKHMLTLMNNARLGVGFESIGLCETAYRLSRDYAAERKSMGKSIDRHEIIADYLDEMRTDILGIRAIAMRAAVAEELSRKIGLRTMRDGSIDAVSKKRLEKRKRAYAREARWLTPLLKYHAAEKAVFMARQAVQIHGGNGYMREYGAEKLLRDAMVMPIYEGTSQIQALMVMKDALGAIMKNPQAFVRREAQARWRSLSADDLLERRVAKLRVTTLGTQRLLMTRVAAKKVKALAGKPVTSWTEEFFRNWDPKRDFAFALLHAERLTQLMVLDAIADTLLKQAKKSPARRAILERHLERAEPLARFLVDSIASTGERLLERLAETIPKSAAAAE